MDETESKIPQIKMKGVMKHTLKPPTKQLAICKLLCNCVLKHMPGYDDRSNISKAIIMQGHLRQQYYRLIKHDPDNRLDYTYKLNCCPAGFDVTPETRFCTQPQICPWCHVRRWLFPAYQALHKVPKAIREEHAVVVWRRGQRNVKAPAFFASNYGPHQWCNALVTVQLGFPWPHFATNSVMYYHLGMQIVPKSCDVNAALTRRAVMPALSIVRRSKATTENIFTVMSHVTSLPWLPLYSEDNFQFFANAVQASKAKSSRFLRITPYRERNTDGNYQSSVPEE